MSGAIELDWATWDAEHGGGGHGYGKMSAAAREKAHQTAHNTASATAKRHAASRNRARKSSGAVQVRHEGTGTHGVYFKGHRIGGVSSLGNGVHYAYRDAVPGTTSHGSLTDAVNHMVKAHRASLRSGAGTAAAIGNANMHAQFGLANGAGGAIEMAMSQCPRCGYRSDDADFAVSGGIDGTSSPSQPGELRTPQRAPNGSGTLPLRVRGAGSPSMGLANGSGRSISLARRMPVRTPGDLLVSRQPDGSAIVRHRQGASEIGKLRPMGDGTWQSVVDEHDLTPGRSQRAALAEMIGVYNSTTVTPDRAAQPLVPAPVQTPLMERFGVEPIRLASDPDDDGDNDDSASGDTDDDYAGGLSPRGQGIFKKLRAKGMSPKVARAMAMRAQNTKAGSFGQKAS